MRRIIIVAFLALAICGCSRSDRLAFDEILSTNHIDRIEIEFSTDDSTRKNIITGDKVAIILASFSATNRLGDPIHSKSEVLGKMGFYDGQRGVGGLSYFGHEQVWAFRGYEFSLQDTNRIAWLFK